MVNLKNHAASASEAQPNPVNAPRIRTRGAQIESDVPAEVEPWMYLPTSAEQQLSSCLSPDQTTKFQQSIGLLRRRRWFEAEDILLGIIDEMDQRGASNRDLAAVHIVFGQTCRDRMGRLQEEHEQIALGLLEGDPDALVEELLSLQNNLAITHQKANRNGEAEALLIEAINSTLLFPKEAFSAEKRCLYLNLAQVYVAAGLPDKSQTILEEAELAF